MISDKMRPLVENNSVIRMMFEEGKKMAEEFGAENVFDFSLGNPNVPAPDSVNKAIKEISKSFTEVPSALEYRIPIDAIHEIGQLCANRIT